MLTIRDIHSSWDKYNRPDGIYTYDQDKLNLSIDEPFYDTKVAPDLRLDHVDYPGETAGFFINQYCNGDVIGFTHHGDVEHLDTCSGPKPSHTFHSWCGFAGASFTYELETGPVKVVGPWSSGAYHYNEQFPNQPIAHVYEVGIWESKYRGSSGNIRIPALLKLLYEQSLPYVLVTGLWVGNNENAYEIVHRDDVSEFIAFGGIHETFREPGKTRWLSQSQEQFEAGIKNARVWGF